MLWPLWVHIGWLCYVRICELCSKALRFVLLSSMAAISACAGFSSGRKTEHTLAGTVLSSVA